MIAVQIDARDIDRVIAELRATEPQVRRALGSTLRKMAAWVKARSVKGLSKELEVQQKLIRRRLRTIKAKPITNGGVEVRVWFGLDPISLIYLGARKSGRGVKAGARFVEGGFIAEAKGGRQVFKRKGRARLPIEKQTAKINAKAERFLDDGLLNAPAFTEQFYKTLTHELQWQTR